MPDIAKTQDGKKYMWDGKEYPTEIEADQAAQGYAKDGFEILRIVEGDGFLIYSRRVVTETPD